MKDNERSARGAQAAARCALACIVIFVVATLAGAISASN